MRKIYYRAFIALVVCAPLGALTADTSAPAATDRGATNAANDALTDAKIAEIVMTANRAEVAAALTATKKAEKPEVKEFAQMMISAHRANEKEGMQVTRKAGIRPAWNPDAKHLRRDAKAKMASLRNLKGVAFDAGYMSQQISMHESLLNQLEEKFIPSAKDPAFKAYLEKTKAHVEEHLAQAKKINGELPEAKDPPGT